MKNNNVNQLDNLFRQGLGEAETGPPSASWAQMEALLDAQPKQKKRVAAWWWAVAAAVLPLLLAGIWWMTKPQSVDSQIAETKPKSTEQNMTPNVENAPKSTAHEVTSIHEPNSQVASSNQANFNASQNPRNRPTHLKVSNYQSPGTNSLVAKVEPEPKVFAIDPPMPPSDNLNPSKVIDNKEDNNVASIEYKRGKDSEPNDEIASIEFKPNQAKKHSISEQINKLRNSEINLPTIGDAKQNLFALLSHK